VFYRAPRTAAALQIDVIEDSYGITCLRLQMIDVQSRVHLFYDFTTVKQVENNMPIRMAMILPYTYAYIDTYLCIGMYCGRTVGFKSCVYTVHTQACTLGNKKLQGPESKPTKQLRQFSLVTKKQKYGHVFALKQKHNILQNSSDIYIFVFYLKQDVYKQRCVYKHVVLRHQ